MSLLKRLIDKFKKPHIVIEQERYDKAARNVSNDKEMEKIMKGKVYDGRGGPNRKLDEEQQLELIKYIAQGLTPTQVVRKFEDNFGIKLNQTLIYGYKNSIKWKEKIKELKKYYRERPERIEGASKSVRLFRMEYAMEEAAKQHDVRAMVSANQEIKKEFEKEGSVTNVFWNNPIYQEFKSLSPEEQLAKRQELIKEQEEAVKQLTQHQEREEGINGSSRPAEENSAGQ